MLSSKLIRLFLYMRANDLLPQADLLLEMLDAQDTCDISLQLNVNNTNHSSQSENFSNSNTLTTTNMNSTPFAIDNLSLFSNISAMEMDKDDLTDLS